MSGVSVFCENILCPKIMICFSTVWLNQEHDKDKAEMEVLV